MNRSLLTGIAVFATGGIVLGSGYFLGQAGEERAPAGVSVPAADTMLACPGPLVAAEVAEGADSEFVAPSGSEQTLGVAGVPAAGSTTVAQTLAGLMGERGPGEEILRQEDGASFLDAGLALEGPVRVEGRVVGSTPAMVAGSQLSAAGDGDLRGLAVAACTAPAQEQWLLAGGATVGESTRLVLSNPGSTAAEVTVGVFGENGEGATGGRKSVTVAPGASQSLQVEALAPDVASPAVRVSSTGGLVSAALQSSVVDGLDPAGVDISPAAAAPSAEVTVPGVPVAAQEGEPAVPQVLRIANPTDRVAEVRLAATSVGGDADWSRRSTSVPARGVRDVPITGLDPASYSFSLRSSAPVTAAARSGNGEDTDFAWTPAAPALDGAQPLVVPDGAEATLVAGSASGASSVLVTPVGEGGTLGDPQRLDLADGRVAEAALAELFGGNAPAAILLEPGDDTARIYAGVSLRRDSGVAALPIPAAPAGAGTAAVRVEG